MHHGLVGPAAEQVREPGLSEPTRPEDRGDPRVADGGTERPDVLVAADQRGGLEAQPLAHRSVGRQQLAVQRLEGRSGVDAEPVGQVGAVPLVGLERRRRAVHGSGRAQQGHDRGLVVGVHAGEQRKGLVVVAQSRQGAAENGGGDLPVPRRGQPELAERPVRRAARRGQGERLLRQIAGPDQVVVTLGVAGAHHGVAERQRVHRCRSQPEPVAVVGAGHHLGRGLRAGSRDHDLQGLRRVGGHVVRSPDLLDQPFLGDLVARSHKSGQQRVRTPARQRGTLPGHLVEQPQVHRSQRCTAPHRSAARATAASRAAPVSCSVSVRSGARNRSAKASDL